MIIRILLCLWATSLFAQTAERPRVYATDTNVVVVGDLYQAPGFSVTFFGETRTNWGGGIAIEVDTLEDVLGRGNTTTNEIISSSRVQGSEIGVGSNTLSVVDGLLKLNDEDVGNVRTEDVAADQAFLMYDEGVGGYVHQYGPRLVLSHTEVMSEHNAGTRTGIYPGQLLSYSALNPPRVFIATNVIDLTSYPTNDYSWLPLGAADTYWQVFVSDGSQGEQGIVGPSGADGIGDIAYDGAWQYTKSYVYSTSTPVLVRHAGRIYELLQNSQYNDPAGLDGTNYWTIAIDKGAAGEINIYSNLLWRGTWNSGDEYEEWDSITYLGNRFFVSPTNVPPGIGVAPSLADGYVGQDSAYWTVDILRGPQGVQGPQGPAGSVVNYYDIYRLFDTNTVFNNTASSVNNMVKWVSTVGEQMTLTWVPEPEGTTNILEMSAGSTTTTKVLRPDGSGGVTWGDIAAAGITNISITGTGNVITNAYLEGLLLVLQLGETEGVENPLYLGDTLNSGELYFGPDTNSVYLRVVTAGEDIGLYVGNVSSGEVTGVTFGPLAFEDWPASDGQEYVAKNGGWVLKGAEQESLFTNWVSGSFTNAVSALVESIAVTGAVTSINTLDGAVTLSAGEGIGITTSLNSLVISAEGGADQYTLVEGVEPGVTIAITGVVTAVYDNYDVGFTEALTWTDLVEEQFILEDVKHTTAFYAATTNTGYFDADASGKVVAGTHMVIDGAKYYLSEVSGSNVVYSPAPYTTDTLAEDWHTIEAIYGIDLGRAGMIAGIPGTENGPFVALPSGNSSYQDITTHDNQTIYLAGGGSIWKSVDGGFTWADLQAGFSPTAITTPDGITVFAATWGWNHDVRKSSDGGATWEIISEGTANFFHMHAVSDQIVYASSVNSFTYRSTNGAVTWSVINVPVMDWNCITASKDGQVLYIGSSYGIWKSDDAGDNWYDLEVGGGYAYRGITSHDGVIVYASSDSGVRKSVNGGVSWEHILNWNIRWRGIASADGQTIYLSNDNQSPVLKSEWSAVNPSLGVAHSAMLPINTSTNWRYINDVYFRDNNNYTSTFYSVSFSTNHWSIYLTNSTTWKTITTNAAGTWQWNSNGTFVASGLDELGTLSKAVSDDAANRWSRLSIDSMTLSDWQTSGGFIAGGNLRLGVTFIPTATNSPPRTYAHSAFVDDLRYVQKNAVWEIWKYSPADLETYLQHNQGRACDALIEWR